MYTVPRRLIMEAIKEARLDYRPRLVDKVLGRDGFGVKVRDFGEAAAFMFCLGAAIERSARVNDYLLSRMVRTSRLIEVDGSFHVFFATWELEG